MGASCETAVETKRGEKKKLKLITALRVALVSSISMATHLEFRSAALMQGQVFGVFSRIDWLN